MRSRNREFAERIGIAAVVFLSSLCVAQTNEIKSTIDVTMRSAPTSKYEFGMFIEHIGPLIYRSLWSEMLEDRKFYFPITSKEPESQGRGGFPGMQLRKWHPVGPDEAIVMDKKNPSFPSDAIPGFDQAENENASI